jgi:hypothetical protein
MKYVLIAIAVAAFSVPAFALGGNPEAKVFITFTTPTPDNASVVSRVDPVQYTAFTAYLGATDLGMGMRGISFMASVTPSVSSPAAFTNLLPGDLAIGNWETGITLASTECMDADIHPGREYIDPVIFGTLDLFYLGGTGDVMILDHPEYARWILDCTLPDALVDSFCVWTHGGIAKDPEPGDDGCGADTPVETRTWGAIKALYN